MWYAGSRMEELHDEAVETIVDMKSMGAIDPSRECDFHEEEAAANKHSRAKSFDDIPTVMVKSSEDIPPVMVSTSTNSTETTQVAHGDKSTSPNQVVDSNMSLSPTKNIPSPIAIKKKRRPPTPHHPTGLVGGPFDFDCSSPRSPSPKSATPKSTTPRSIQSDLVFDHADADGDERDQREDVSSGGGCIGISLETVLNAFRGLKLRTLTQKAHPTNHCHPPSSPMSPAYLQDHRHVYFSFEGDKSLMQRAASWGTQETEHDLNSLEKRSHVQFHYPPITSVRLRPRTESSDIKQLFFAPEELDEIEEDRWETRLADDIETLAVGADHLHTVPISSSMATASYDEQDSTKGMHLAGDEQSSVMFDKVGSPRKRISGMDNKRLVHGVQIMLREKSTG